MLLFGRLEKIAILTTIVVVGLVLLLVGASVAPWEAARTGTGRERQETAGVDPGRWPRRC